MHRSSENVAAIATALAKAQTELSNPEKSMIGTVYNNRSESPQNFRYASLSSGLDIIRKTLGGQQIAIAQTTDIDRINGTVNLTTVLLHTSGEWISSDWPVCQLSETSAPRRMGAALTYARRYALFSMVGIAGEDDLDAPHFANEPSRSDRPAEAGIAPSSSPEPSPARLTRLRTGNPATPAVRETLSAGESATVRMQLIEQIQSLPEDDLQPRAIAILKAKNKLSADDAKLVEDAFAAKLPLQCHTLTTNESVPTPSDQTPPQSSLISADTRKRPRGRPRKVKVALAPIAATPLPSAPIIDENPPASAHDQADAATNRIQNGELLIGKPRRLRDKAHLKFVGSQPCLVCGRNPADAHHLRFAQSRGMGLKVSDEFTVPLCRAHHRDNHNHGDEVAWWERRAIDRVTTARMLWMSTRGSG
jgi:hypothetical protein